VQQRPQRSTETQGELGAYLGIGEAANIIVAKHPFWDVSGAEMICF
jgi:hypothetical protein